MYRSSLKRPQLAIALTVACALAFSACGQRRPNQGLLSGNISSDRENEGTPLPEDEDSEVTPIEPPTPAPPTPNPVPPKPRNPWEPFPSPPTRPPGPVKPPAPRPSPKPTGGTSVWPSGPVSPTVDLLSLFTRKFSQAIGSYISGKLEKPDTLPPTGEGFKKIFQFRNRGHATLDLIALVMAASKEVHRDFPAAERVQIGDMTDKDGGRQGGHLSHQNGLDADIVYFRKNRREMESSVQSKSTTTGFDEQFVIKGRVTPNFDVDANWKLIQLLVASKSIDRIFIDRKLKQTFCEYSVAKGMRAEWREVLRKLRHEDNHADHMHVRVKCPEKSTKCKTMAEIPAGDGCDRLLEMPLQNTAEIMRMDGHLASPEAPALQDTGDGFGC